MKTQQEIAKHNVERLLMLLFCMNALAGEDKSESVLKNLNKVFDRIFKLKIVKDWMIILDEKLEKTK